MPSFPHLRSLQELFWGLISAPEGTSKGARALVRAGVLESDDLSFLVRGDARLGPAERLDIYADMYFYRLRDCLAEDFPKLACLIGEARFHNLVTDYLLVHPSTHASLRQLGRSLPGFLRTHPTRTVFPAAPDLAELEWARLDVFDETDATPLRGEVLLTRATSASEKLRLALTPACRLLRLDASAPVLWEQPDAGERAARGGGALSARETTGVLVWRKGFTVLHRRLPADEEACLRTIGAGQGTLSRLGGILIAELPGETSPEKPGRRLAELLQLWTQAELLMEADAL